MSKAPRRRTPMRWPWSRAPVSGPVRGGRARPSWRGCPPSTARSTRRRRSREGNWPRLIGVPAAASAATRRACRGRTDDRRAVPLGRDVDSGGCRAGVMEPFANHAFEPRTTVRRIDLALAVEPLLTRDRAALRPGQPRAWESSRFSSPILARATSAYPAASDAVALGVLTDRRRRPLRAIRRRDRRGSDGGDPAARGAGRAARRRAARR